MHSTVYPMHLMKCLVAKSAYYTEAMGLNI